MAAVRSHLQRVSVAVKSQNGSALGALLAGSKVGEAVVAGARNASQINNLCNNQISRPYNQITALQLRSLHAASQKNTAKAFQWALEAAELFFETTGSDKDTNWWLGAVDVVLGQMRTSAELADRELEAQGKAPKNMKIAVELLMRYFRQFIVDRGAQQTSKKMGALFVIVHLFKMYFRMNNLSLCGPLIKAVDSPTFPNFNKFPTAQRVAYKYYLGRIRVFEDDYDAAQSCLDYALQHCHKDSPRNKRRILQFLIPVKLLLGTYPKPELLHKYSLLQFDGIIQAMRKGNLQAFNEGLEQHQDFFIKKGVFLILEKLQPFVYRNLFRKIHAFWARENPAKKHQLKLSVLQAGLRVNGVTDIDGDELECIIANLIFQGSVKGYIAHRRCVVLSQKTPFPKRR